MSYDYWRKDSQLYKASLAERPGFVVNDLPSSQPHQNYLPSVSGDIPPVATQHCRHHPMYGGDSTSNDQRDIHVATGQPSHNTSFNHSHTPSFDDRFVNNQELFVNNLDSSGNVSESRPIEGHPHPVHDSPLESHTSSCSFVCKWDDGHGPCDTTTVSVEELVNHVSSSHLPPPGPTPLKCKWQGCRLRKLICRNTILRHIRQIELGISPRRQ
ncbi:hypothetical protein C8R48DRAFT_781703 [Suillus tomentosus]|nr:hypothetical protein C8R48DRAFT_781703 [Suillus tomentosus]